MKTTYNTKTTQEIPKVPENISYIEKEVEIVERIDLFKATEGTSYNEML